MLELMYKAIYCYSDTPQIGVNLCQRYFFKPQEFIILKNNKFANLLVCDKVQPKKLYVKQLQDSIKCAIKRTNIKKEHKISLLFGCNATG